MTDITLVRYSLPDNSQVKVEPQGWSCPQPCETYHQATITQWEEGRTDEWDLHKAQYDNYTAIMSYDQDVLDYDQCIIDNPTEPELCTYPAKPSGYSTQEEATASEEAHAQWVVSKAEWDNSNTEPYPVREPTILLIPADLPAVPPPSPLEEDLVPNVIEAYDSHYGQTTAQVKESAQNTLDSDCSTHIYASISAETQMNISNGLIEQSIAEICKQEISGALIENKGYIDDIELLNTNAEIDAYMANISRIPLTGGR